MEELPRYVTGGGAVVRAICIQSSDFFIFSMVTQGKQCMDVGGKTLRLLFSNVLIANFVSETFNSIAMTSNSLTFVFLAVVVGQLVERSFPTREVRG